MFLALKQLACEPGSQRKACKQASIRENRHHVFLSCNFSLTRASFNHSRPVDFESLLPSLCVNINLKLSIFYRRASKDAALEKLKLAMSSPITLSSSRLSHSISDEMWTPSAVLALDKSTEIQDYTSKRKCSISSLTLRCMY